ncbi:hypothetical protein LACWKB8_0855 [Lactobacillus sp. wkB8]|uniref:tetratricopeptide repeat protein n=1 Tax=Lactobacillus sp. wkB8 TaxID=1545702 RepID=UPI00050D850E|nr:CDC27 family protein [Lactobacillus sp. wkB8]AIS09126.1 hypothetical protein LACWKB8_0855 [Lactobacillus sp. wkB8]
MTTDKKAAGDSTPVKKRVHELIKKIDAHPHDSENYLKLATYLIEQGSSDQAAELLEKAKNLVAHPQDLDYDLAVCYYMQGKFDQALSLFKQIPNDDLVLYQKALVFFKIGQNQKALAYALTIKNVDAKVLELIGDIWLSLGNLKEAEMSYSKIPTIKRTAKSNFMLGITILTRSRKEAEKYFARSKEQDPKLFSKEQKQYASILKLVNEARKKND